MHKFIAPLRSAADGQLLNDPQAAREAAGAIRSLTGKVVLTPEDSRGAVNATLRGELIALLDLAAGRHPTFPGPEL